MLFFTCKEVTEMVATDALDRAGWLARARARVHLLMCTHCRRYAHQLRVIAERVRALADQDADLDADVVHKLEEDITRRVTRGGSP